MNGSFLHADSTKARMGYIARAALDYYCAKHPSHEYQGMRPDISFFEDFMGACVDREEAMIALAERPNQGDARSLELIAKIRRANKMLAAQLNISEQDL